MPVIFQKKRSFFLLILCSLLAISEGFGQETKEKKVDVVYLTNGERIEGMLVTYLVDKHLVIMNKRGKSLRFEANEIERVTQETSLPRPIYLQKKGIAFLGQAGLITSPNTWPFGAETSFSINAVLGYRWKHYLQVGVGGQADVYRRWPMYPVYLDIRGDFFPKRLTPHYYLQSGYGITNTRVSTQLWGWGEHLFKGGPMFGAGFGLKLHTRTKAAMVLSAGYQLQNSYLWQNWGVRIDDIEWELINRPNFQRINIRFGVSL